VFPLHNFYHCALRGCPQECAWQAVPAGEDSAHLASGCQEVLSVINGETDMVQPFTFLGKEVRDRSGAQWLDNLKADILGRGILGRQPQQAYAHVVDNFVMDALES
jgi:hypothetical protein